MIASLINRFGDSIDAIASTWLVYQITGSAAWPAIIFGINRVPTIFVTPLAGPWVEGRNKKAIMLVKTHEEKQHFDVQEYFSNLKSGFQYAKNNKLIRNLLGVGLFLNAVLVPFNSLQAPLVSEIYQGGAEVLSLMGISVTVSMLLGSMLYPKLDGKMRGKTIFSLSGVCIGLFYAGTVMCQPLYANKIFMYVFVVLSTGLFGFCVAIANSYANVEMMRSIDEGYLACVGAIMTALCVAATPVVSFIISAVVAYVSTRRSL